MVNPCTATRLAVAVPAVPCPRAGVPAAVGPTARFCAGSVVGWAGLARAWLFLRLIR